MDHQGRTQHGKNFTAAFALFALGLALAGGPAMASGGDDDDNDAGVIKFDERTFYINEEAGTVTIVVERSHGEDGSVGISYRTDNSGTAAAGSDYTPVSGSFTWSSGDGSNRTFTIPILNDGEAEGQETIGLELFAATGGVGIDDERGTSRVVILANDGGSGGGGNGGGSGGGGSDDDDDNNGIGIVKFDESSFEVVESAGVALIRVERSRGEAGRISVDYATVDGTATAGQDYTATSGTLTWAAGDGSTQTFSVPLNDDTLAEGGETVTLVLSNPTGGTTIDGQRGVSTLVLLANDGGSGGSGGGGTTGGAGEIKFAEASYEVIEEAGTAQIRVERSGGENGVASVAYRIVSGTATAGSDFQDTSGTLTWAAGDGSTKTFAVPLIDDSVREDLETATLVLSDAQGAALSTTRDEATLKILASDTNTVATNPLVGTNCVAPGDGTLCLLGGRFQVTVQWKDPQGQTGQAHAAAVSDQSGLFWFFDRSNYEVLIKVLDACPDFGGRWVFYAATTNVELDIVVTDTRTGRTKSYRNALGQAAVPVQDTATFAGCN